jgi:hypothetical protein
LDLRPPKGGLFFGQKAVENPEKWLGYKKEVKFFGEGGSFYFGKILVARTHLKGSARGLTRGKPP